MALAEDWAKYLMPEFEKPYMRALRAFLAKAHAQKKIIYPDKENIFSAFRWTAYDNVKVVIIGQDPYHGPKQAHGLSFSVPPGVAVPPSLQNIYKELQSDIGIAPRQQGNLVSWAQQGILLLNSVLTVEAGEAASHQGQGWETFTDAVIQHLNHEKTHLVFLLWGSYAQKKGQVISRDKHYVIESVHPSPLSAYRGFFGSKPFSKINAYLLSKGKEPIDWQIPKIAT